MQQNDISSLKGEIASVNQKLSTLDTKLYLLSYRVAPGSAPLIYGNPQLNDTNSSYINILSPTNGSHIGRDFSIEGNAILSEQTKIYIISKIAGKYWILMDGIADQMGNWKSAKNCSLPATDNYNCDNQEIFAIVAKEAYGIGSDLDMIPNYLARSNTVYANVCSIGGN